MDHTLPPASAHTGWSNGSAPLPQRGGVELFDPARRTPPDAAALACRLESSRNAGPRLILWDLVGTCNLRCPSCAVGSMAGANPKGLISEELFSRILEKLAREFLNWQLHFYNWTEPLIHPRIVKFCKAAAEAGFHLHVSSNLNHLKDPEGLMAAGLKTFRISLSGFTQAVYGCTHRGGDIEKVKRNMKRLSEARIKTGSRTRVHVYYHKYRHNLHELPLMQSYAHDLGFEFYDDWAYLMPVEKLIEYLEGDLPAAHRQFVDDYIVPSVNDAIAFMQPRRNEPCELIDQLVIDFQGNLALCCATYESKKNTVGNYLDVDWRELQGRRYSHAACEKCMHYGAHVFYPHFSRPDLKEQVAVMAQACLKRSVEKTARRSVSLPVLHPLSLAESA